ncbi:MAG TPA: hypothetical protein VMH92_12065 [Acidocella sp.]|nr:hypothetical protein [Acidocella sp.]
MRCSRPAFLACLSLLAGCAASRPVAQQAPDPAQGGAYTAKVLSIRPVSAGVALPQVMQILGAPSAATPAPAQEIVVQLPDGSVKSLVPPPGATPAALAPGAQVVITETPQMRIIAR